MNYSHVLWQTMPIPELKFSANCFCCGCFVSISLFLFVCFLNCFCCGNCVSISLNLSFDSLYSSLCLSHVIFPRILSNFHLSISTTFTFVLLSILALVVSFVYYPYYLHWTTRQSPFCSILLKFERVFSPFKKTKACKWLLSVQEVISVWSSLHKTDQRYLYK